METSRKFKDYRDLEALAAENDFVVTAAQGGRHNVNSKHYRGQAIDVRTRDKTAAEIENFIKLCRALKLTVRDERRRPARQKIWTGPHLHVEI